MILTEAVKKELTDKLTIKTGREIGIKDVIKNNDTIMAGAYVVPRKEEYEKVSPIVYIEECLTDSEGILQEEYVNDIANRLMAEVSSMNADVQGFANIIHNWETVKEAVFCRLINTEANKEKLKGIPNIPCVMDTSLVFVIDVETLGLDGFIPENMVATITVTNKILETWDISLETLDQKARENSRKKVSIIPMNNILQAMMPEEVSLTEGAEQVTRQMFVVSNEQNCYGACGVLLEGVLEEISDKVDSNLVILPSSVHECIVVPDETPNMEEYAKMVSDINGDENIIKKEDFLSNKPFVFAKKTVY